MLGPANGDLLHGESRLPGTPAGYGLDLDTVLASRRVVSVRPAEVDEHEPAPVTATAA